MKARSTRRGDPSPHVVANMAESLEDPLAVRLIYYKFHTLSRSNSRYMLLVPPRTAPPALHPTPEPPTLPHLAFPPYIVVIVSHRLHLITVQSFVIQLEDTVPSSAPPALLEDDDDDDDDGPVAVRRRGPALDDDDEPPAPSSAPSTDAASRAARLAALNAEIGDVPPEESKKRKRRGGDEDEDEGDADDENDENDGDGGDGDGDASPAGMKLKKKRKKKKKKDKKKDKDGEGEGGSDLDREARKLARKAEKLQRKAEKATARARRVPGSSNVTTTALEGRIASDDEDAVENEEDRAFIDDTDADPRWGDDSDSDLEAPGKGKKKKKKKYKEVYDEAEEAMEERPRAKGKGGGGGRSGPSEKTLIAGLDEDLKVSDEEGRVMMV